MAAIGIVTACGSDRLVGLSASNDSSIGGSGSGSGTTGSGANSSPTAADTFTIVLHVSTRPATGDTVQGDPVVGATATLTKTEWTFIKGKGSDTMSGRNVTVGTATTDANGDAHFDRLSADLYRTVVAPPSGSTLAPATVSIHVLNAATVVIPVRLHP